MAGTEWISAAEAARRLGIKQATLYSYVSRGVLTRPPGRPAAAVVPPPALAARRREGQPVRSAARSRSWPAGGARAGHRAWPGW